ncbi:MAG: hypothetical protein IKC24_07790 [Oscillospiraceae bacterium]|nr:hypothetical protein [Oscillospiraceae bacterium]
MTVETTEAPPVAVEARLFRGCGTIGGHKMSGNRHAATVFKEKESAMGCVSTAWCDTPTTALAELPLLVDLTCFSFRCRCYDGK